MTDEPGTEFEISNQSLGHLARKLEKTGADSLVDAFPAPLLAAAWRALLEGGAIDAPTRVDLDRAEVVVVGPMVLELRVPVRTKSAEFVKTVPVWVEKWSASGDLPTQLYDEAGRLAQALEAAASQTPFDHYTGTGQKPHN